MVDGNVGGALIEFGDRIAARLQERRDELIGFRDRALRVIDKARLHHAPVRCEAFAFRSAQLTDIQALDPRRAFDDGIEMGLGRGWAIRLAQHGATAAAFSIQNSCPPLA